MKKRFILFTLVGLMFFTLPLMAEYSVEQHNEVIKQENLKYIDYDNLPSDIKQYVDKSNDLLDKQQGDKALEQLQLILDAAIPSLGETHPIIPSTYLNIAMIYYGNSEYQKAIEYCQKAVPLFIAIPHSEFKLHQIYTLIGYIYANLDSPDLAEEYKQRAIDIMSSYEGDEKHFIYAQLEMAMQYAFSAKQKEFEELATNIEPQIVRVFGAESMEMVRLYVYWGMSYPADIKCLSYYDKALAILLAHHPKEYDWIGSCYFYIGDFNKNVYEHVKAIDNYNKAISYYSKNKDANAVGLADIHQKLADIYIKQQKYSVAEKTLNKALNLYQDKEQGNYILANIYQSFGMVNLYQKKVSAAESYFYKAEQLYKQDSNNNLQLSFFYTNIGYCYQDIQNKNKAIEYYQKALNEIYNVSDADPSEICTIYLAIATLYVKYGEFENAALYADKMLELNSRQDGIVPETEGFAYLVYAFNAMQKQDWKTVRHYAQKTLDNLVPYLGNDNYVVLQCRQMIQLLNANGL